MTLEVALYGRLREAGLGPSTEVAVGTSPTAGDLLEALAAALGPRGDWLEGAVVATEEAVLGPRQTLPAGARLAVLPPVCGG